MKRFVFFSLLLLPTCLALIAASAAAAPMVAPFGNAQGVLALKPDPPVVGNVHAVFELRGVRAQAPDFVRFSSIMPSMGMHGPAGIAKRTRSNRYEFDLAMQMAAPWALSIQLADSARAVATFQFIVGSSSRSAANSVPGTSGMAGMTEAGDAGAWRTATLALAILLAVGGLVAILRARSRRRGGRTPNWFDRAVTLGAIAVVVVIGAAVVQSRFAAPSMDMSAMSNVKGSAPIPVTLVRAQRSARGQAIAAPGIIQAFFTQDVMARVPGILRGFTAYSGTRVRAGETLGILEEPELGAQSAAAAAGARSDAAAAASAMIEARQHAPNAVIIARADAAAKAERERYWRAEIQRERMLFENGAVSRQEYEDERAQASAAQADAEAASRQAQNAAASVDMAQQQALSAQQRAASSGSSAQAAAVMAGYTHIVAPDDAIVVKRLVDPGTYVQAGTPVLRIAVVDKARIQANIAQDDLPGVRIGAVLDAKLPDGRVVHARVTSVQPAADPTTHTALVEAIVDNPGGRLVPGTYVRVIIAGVSSRVANAVNVPTAAVVGAGADTIVWADVNATAHRVPVRIISDDGTNAQVSGDLKAGDRVVVEGATSLEEGVPIAEWTP